MVVSIFKTSTPSRSSTNTFDTMISTFIYLITLYNTFQFSPNKHMYNMAVGGDDEVALGWWEQTKCLA